MYISKPFIPSFLMVLIVGLVAMTAPALAQDQKVKDTPNNKAKMAFKEAAEAFQGKEYAKAIDKFLESEEWAQQAENENLAQKARNNAIKLQYNLGKQQLEQGNFAEAIKAYEKGIDFAPNFSNNYFMKGYALKQQEKADEAITWYEKAVEVAQEQGNTAIVNKANNNIAGIYLERASKAFDQENYEVAIGYIDQATEYIEPDASTYYQYARAYNGLNQYEQALQAATNGLDVVNSNNRQDVSNLNFEKGIAHKNLGQKQEAIDAFRNVTAGPYQQNAKYELEHNLDVDV